MIIARQDDTFIDIVHLEEVDCPIGTFQPTESNCIQACLNKHADMAYLGDRYVVSSAGDNVNPTFVYCNYMKGYYNPEGKLTLNYDMDLIWNPDFCVNENKCKNGQFPLPGNLLNNGSLFLSQTRNNTIIIIGIRKCWQCLP
jgi:hypothetical protein